MVDGKGNIMWQHFGLNLRQQVTGETTFRSTEFRRYLRECEQAICQPIRMTVTYLP